MCSETGNNNLAVSASNLGKCYQIYNEPIDRLKQALLRWRKQYYREFWALRDVSFDVRQGEGLGIIGRNGSGKSTLLQIIASTLSPSEGDVRVNGRVAALLELGSGFNPDFTGKENVFMNGAILGIPRREMERRYDDIVAFAEIGEFIDQPVRTYSSGMFVRLAFSVATSIDPDVLIVDEALAVGDILFQHRCIGRIRQLCNNGTTLIFVSHDPEAVKALCHQALWLENGRPFMFDDARLVSERYRETLFREHNKQIISEHKAKESTAQAHAEAAESLDGSNALRVIQVRVSDEQGRETDALDLGQRFMIEVACEAQADIDHLSVGFVIKDRLGIEMTGESVFNKQRRGIPVEKGRRVVVRFSGENNLRAGEYSVAVRCNRVSRWDRSDNILLYNNEMAAAFRVLSDVDQPLWFCFRQPFEVTIQ